MSISWWTNIWCLCLTLGHDDDDDDDDDDDNDNDNDNEDDNDEKKRNHYICTAPISYCSSMAPNIVCTWIITAQLHLT